MNKLGIKLDFHTSNETRQKVYNAAVEREYGNITDFGGRNIIIEGGGYNGIWLETRPMGGEMFVMYNIDAAHNNQIMFMENIRSDDSIPSIIRYNNDNATFDLMFSYFQGYCFPYHALNMYYITGKNKEYLEYLYDVLERFDSYLWKTRDSDSDGCLES